MTDINAYHLARLRREAAEYIREGSPRRIRAARKKLEEATMIEKICVACLLRVFAQPQSS